jgi:hypothetical protein
MNTQKKLEDKNVDVKLKLAMLWTSFMFLYIYVDYFALYMPGKIDNIIKGKIFVFDITQEFIFIALALAVIPILMIYFSIALPARINQLTNIIVAIVLIPYMLFNLAGEAWMHMYFAAAVEVLLLCLIIRYAWRWPEIEVSNP